jgi:hypothetical protein
MTLAFYRIGQRVAALAPSYRYGVVLPAKRNGPMKTKALASYWRIDNPVSKPASAPNDAAILAAIEQVNKKDMPQ